MAITSKSATEVRDHHCALIQAALWRRILEMATTMAADKIVRLRNESGAQHEHEAAQSPPRNRQRAGGVRLDSPDVEGRQRPTSAVIVVGGRSAEGIAKDEIKRYRGMAGRGNTVIVDVMKKVKTC
jgi:hypothetical protein